MGRFQSGSLNYVGHVLFYRPLETGLVLLGAIVMYYVCVFRRGKLMGRTSNGWNSSSMSIHGSTKEIALVKSV